MILLFHWLAFVKHNLQCAAATNTVAWHPKQNLLAYAGDERDKYEHDKGIVRLWGFPPAST